MSQKPKYITRAIFFLAFLVNVIFLPDVAYSASRSLWQERQEDIQYTTTTQKPVKKTFQRQIDPLKIKIPEEYGTIVESHRGSNGSLIIHIQDAHANYEGQMNLANILESLIKDYGLNLILVEGGSTDSDFTYLRKRASLKERKEKAGKLLRDSIITGEEYLNIASDYPMSFQGIEDRAIYDANLDALWQIDRFKKSGVEYIDKLIVASNTLKQYIYNKDLLDIDKAKEGYKNEKLKILDYYKYLYDSAEKKNISLEGFPNFVNLIKISELEKRIDIDKIKERKATDDEITLYKEYVKASENLDTNKLFKEEPEVEKFLMENLAVSPDQKALIKISRALSIMKNLLNVKVIPEEYAYFLKNKREFSPLTWAAFLKEKSNKYNLSPDVPNNYHILTNNLQKIEDFYALAQDRNSVFIRKTEKRMKKDDAKIAALISGGFHTPMVLRLLAERGYSYVVVGPKITKETDEEFYRSTLRRQWLPEE